MNMNWRVLGTVILALAGGCFWASAPPNFKSDPIKQLVVLWDMPEGTGTVVQTTWQTTNRDEVATFANAIQTTTWESSSILLRSHPTRILLTTAGGVKWEMHIHTPDRLSLFNINDPGRSGTVKRGENDLIALLTVAISQSVGQAVDLSGNYEADVYNKRIRRTVPEATIAIQKEYWVRN
jgi:hypothetical protein